MSEETVSKEMRDAERFVTKPKTSRATYGKGYWKPIEFPEIKKGDIFRLWNKKGGNRLPDYTIDGKHDVCVAVSNAYEHEDSYGVESISVRGF